MKTSKTNQLVALTLLHVLAIPAFSQPYYFYGREEGERKYVSVYRLNLSTGVSEKLLPDEFRAVNIEWDPTQTWLYLMHARGPSEIVNIKQPTIRGVVPEEDAISWVQGIFYVPRAKRFYVTYVKNADESAIIGTEVYDDMTFNKIDTCRVDIGFIQPVLSEDGEAMYFFSQDTMDHNVYIYSYSTISNTLVRHVNLMGIGPPTKVKGPRDARKGIFLIKYNYPTTRHEDGYCFIYNPVTHYSGIHVPFPWRAEYYLSPDTKRIIIERVDFDTTRPSVEYRPGNVYVFEAQTGKLMQRLTLPPEGKVLIFDNYPDKFYYFNEQSLQSVPVDLTVITPTNVLLDTLIAMKHQAEALGWLGDKNFVNELDNHLENAQKHLAKGDSVNCGKEVEKFQEKVQKEYENTVDNEKKNKPRDKRFVTVEGWKFLYYNAQYIVDRLPKKKGK